MADLEAFHGDFFNQIRASADAAGNFLEAAFLELFCNYLVDCGEFDTFDAAHYRASRGMRVDGYAGDPADADGVLTLVISDFNPDQGVVSLTRTEVDGLFRRLSNFLNAALSEDFRADLEEESEGYGVAELIAVRRMQITRVRLFLVSNRNLSAKVGGFTDAEVGGLPVSYNIWDISRLHRLVSSGKEREDIEIDLTGDFGEALACLPASVGGDGYDAYLAAVPGTLLAKIYDRFGARLLEQNVRCFLQARGKTNKGIRQTILNEPGMFFAYNNGITATAEQVTCLRESGSVRITSLRNLQIVNGGQTTASIFTALKKDKADLQRIFVQMKLSVVEPSKSGDIVPKISEFANSQNKVNAADFFSNHPFHVRVEDFSRRLWAPATDGTFKETKWFYERARGQYLDQKALRTPAEQKRFEQEFPKEQSFTKTDLAKFEMVWEQLPHTISRGAQESFAAYAKLTGQRWAKNSDQFGEMYYRAIIARAILFRTLEKDVSAQGWYSGGYRANIVAYAMAKFAQLIAERSKFFDFDDVWRQQASPNPVRSELISIAEAMQQVLQRPAAGMANVTQWAKLQACWQQATNTKHELSAAVRNSLLDAADQKTHVREAKKTQKVDDAIKAQTQAVKIGHRGWEAALSFALGKKLLSPAQRGIMAAVATPGRVPSEKQSLQLMVALQMLKTAGFVTSNLD